MPDISPYKLIRECVGHTNAVNAVRLTHDGNFCMTASDDKTICLWNPHKDDPSQYSGIALLIKTYAGIHSYPIYDIAISSDNTKFVSAGSDRAFFVWDVVSARIIRKISGGHTQKINSVALNFDNTVVLTASDDKNVCIWDLRSNMRDPIQTLSEGRDSITSVLSTPSGQIISGSVDGCLRIYDIRAGKLSTDELSKDPIVSLSLANDGKCVLAMCVGGSIHLVEESSGLRLQEYKGQHKHTAYKSEARVLSDQSTIACGSEDGSVCFYQYVDGKQKGKLDFQNLPSGSSSYTRKPLLVTSLASHPTNPVLLAGLSDGKVKCITKTD